MKMTARPRAASRHPLKGTTLADRQSRIGSVLGLKASRAQTSPSGSDS